MWQRAAAFFILKIRVFCLDKNMAHPGSGRVQLLSCLTNAALAPSPNLSPRYVAEHGSTHSGERD